MLSSNHVMIFDPTGDINCNALSKTI